MIWPRRAICLITLLAVQAGCTDVEESGQDVPLDWQVVDARALQDPDGAMTPVPWGIVADPDRRVVYVLDAPNQRVVMFDGDGAFAGQFGRAGAGPGEFRDPWAIARRPDGTLTILDATARQISRWSPEGDWLSAEPSPSSYWGPAIADLGDRLVMVTTSPPGDPLEIKQDLVEVSNGASTRLASVSQYQTMVDLPCLRAPLPAPKPMAPEPVWSTMGDTVIVVSGPAYALDLYHDGELVGTYRRAVPPVDVTEEMAIQQISSGELRIFIARCGVDARAVAQAMDWKATVAPVRRITVAPDGRIWATRTGSSLHEARVDVLERDGSYLGTMENIPSPITFLSATEFVGFGSDDEFGVTLQIVEVSAN